MDETIQLEFPQTECAVIAGRAVVSVSRRRVSAKTSASTNREEKQNWRSERLWRSRRHLTIGGFECTAEPRPPNMIAEPTPSVEWDEEFAQWIAEYAWYPAVT